MIKGTYRSRTRKVNTMQDASFEEKLNELVLHAQDYIEEHSYPHLISIEKITMSTYDNIHDGGFIVLKVDPTEMSVLKDMEESLRRPASYLQLGGLYVIEGTTVLRVFAY